MNKMKFILTGEEKKRWDVLNFKCKHLIEDSIKVQAEYNELFRWNKFDRRLPQMADRAVKYQVKVIEAKLKKDIFYNQMKMKYVL